MSNIRDTYRALAAQTKQERASRRDFAAAAFPVVSRYAWEYDLRLRRFTESHYQLSPMDWSWILNIYPGNRRLYSDRTKVAPYLNVPDNWGLMDVVKAAIAAERDNG